jgi:NAD(P)-dependent dehydrogenase (short-subunit alcohol dehydrogenase family)
MSLREESENPITAESDSQIDDADELRFDGQVAIVTGGGGSIGRAYALLLASRGARVLVNDLGIDIDGKGHSLGPAQQVVDEIRSAGGEALADGNSVATMEGANALIRHAVEDLGPVDILIHNAGRNVGEFEDLLDVHLRASYWLTEAVWPAMVEREYGRIVLTTSAAGLYGSGIGPHFNPKQHYATAKMGIVGMGKALAARGRPANITVNLVSPTSQSRLRAANIGVGSTRPEAGVGAMDPHNDWAELYAFPHLVAAGVVWLVHRDCPVTGEIFTAGAGRVGNVFLGVTRGFWSPDLRPEDPIRHFSQIIDRENYFVPADMADYAKWQREVMADNQARAQLHPIVESDLEGD